MLSCLLERLGHLIGWKPNVTNQSFLTEYWVAVTLAGGRGEGGREGKVVGKVGAKEEKEKRGESARRKKKREKK